jgi:hypothetical protein
MIIKKEKRGGEEKEKGKRGRPCPLSFLSSLCRWFSLLPA